MKRPRRTARLIRGWEEGFSAGPSFVLGTLARGYHGLLDAREWLYERGVLRANRLACPVVSVGNLTVGGTGKTPAVELAVKTLSDLGCRPAVVSRGYRRQSSGVQVVADTASIRLDADEAGDEPFLLARRMPGIPIVVGSNRYEAAYLAVQRFGATAIVLDDGFQHRTLTKDLEIVMVRARNPWGNGRLLPHGPLREPLAALARADLVVAATLGGEDLGEVERTVAAYAPTVPVIRACYVAVECWEAERMRPHPVGDLGGGPLVAFAGIASPDAFRRTLQGLGVNVVDMVVLADHHWYTAAELRELAARARAIGASGLVTTEKDWVRLRRLLLPPCPVYVVSIRLELTAGEDAWRQRFAEVCRAR